MLACAPIRLAQGGVSIRGSVAGGVGGSGEWRRTKAFSAKGPAERYANAMETDREPGEYIDPEAGKVRFEEVAGRWLASRVVNLSSLIKYESALRLHVNPVFGRRQLRAIRPSDCWVGRRPRGRMLIERQSTKDQAEDRRAQRTVGPTAVGSPGTPARGSRSGAVAPVGRR